MDFDEINKKWKQNYEKYCKNCKLLGTITPPCNECLADPEFSEFQPK